MNQAEDDKSERIVITHQSEADTIMIQDMYKLLKKINNIRDKRVDIMNKMKTDCK